MNSTHSPKLYFPALAALPAVQIIGFAILTAVAAQFRIPLPFTPVPITLQTLVVTLAGALIGWRKGALSQLLYLVWGGFGAPLFAGGAFGFAVFAGPTGGYLVGFVVGAMTAGLLTPAKPSYFTAWWTQLAASLPILFFGWLHLTIFVGNDPGTAFMLGVAPFILGDVLKVTASAGIVKALK